MLSLYRILAPLMVFFALINSISVQAQEISIGVGAAFLRSSQKNNEAVPSHVNAFVSSLNYRHPITKQWAWSSSLLFMVGESKLSSFLDEFSAPQSYSLKVRNGVLSTGICWSYTHLQKMTFLATVEAGAEYTTSSLERAIVEEQVKRVVPVLSLAFEEQFRLSKVSIGLQYRFLLPVVARRSNNYILQGSYDSGHLITAMLLFRIPRA